MNSRSYCLQYGQLKIELISSLTGHISCAHRCGDQFFFYYKITADPLLISFNQSVLQTVVVFTASQTQLTRQQLV